MSNKAYTPAALNNSCLKVQKVEWRLVLVQLQVIIIIFLGK